jgi:hypothetical protein
MARRTRSSAWYKRDRRAAPHASRRLGGVRTVLMEPFGALPSKHLFISFYLFVYAEEEMRATMSVYKGQYSDHGWAVYFTQHRRKCCLLDTTTYGLSYEEALWTALSALASFQPRQAKRPYDPGQLFYPSEYSHLFEEYWDYLGCLDKHTGFGDESQ